LIAMKLLAYVHTYNDGDVIDATLRALCAQSYPIPEILLIDNASTDDTLDRAFPSKVTIIRNDENLGTSGAVAAGMEYALAHGYDWIYILDADSEPAPDAVENLMRCYQSLSPELQATTWWLSSLLVEAEGGAMHHGCIVTPGGIKMLDPPPQPTSYRCHLNIWSGSLYRLDAVKEVGLPDRNYVLDWGDMIYGYEGAIRGYSGFLEQSSIVTHNMHPLETLRLRRIGRKFVKVFYSPPLRSYYFWRNSMYFWIYRFDRGGSVTPVIWHFFQFFKWLIKVSLFIKAPGESLAACLRGMWDGVHARLENRY